MTAHEASVSALNVSGQDQDLAPDHAVQFLQGVLDDVVHLQIVSDGFELVRDVPRTILRVRQCLGG